MATNPVEIEKAQAAHLYDQVLKAANDFLHNCDHFPMEILKLEDPSYAEIAEQLFKLVKVITLLTDDFDPMMGSKAHDYCELMTKMGVAIQKGETVLLASLVAEMKRKPGS